MGQIIICGMLDGGGAVWKLTTAGISTQYLLDGARPYGICVGPDNNLWLMKVVRYGK